MGLSPPIKPCAVGYLDMKDVHKKHISLGYGYLFCVLLQAGWKSFWHVASKDFLLPGTGERKDVFVPLNMMWNCRIMTNCDEQLWPDDVTGFFSNIHFSSNRADTLCECWRLSLSLTRLCTTLGWSYFSCSAAPLPPYSNTVWILWSCLSWGSLALW